jgi:hypothetical protein
MDIVDVIYSYLPAKRRQTPSGWAKFNAVCCVHNNNTPDTRQRAGIIRNGDGCSYHCFNCGFKSSYVLGRHLPRKMRQLLGWLGVPDDIINKLALEALKIETDQKVAEAVSLPVFEDKPLPEDSRSFKEWSTFLSMSDDSYITPEGLTQAVEYIDQRKVGMFSYPFYWSKELADRVIIPFFYEGRTVGYTARKLTDGKPKYLSEQTPGYVFNLDSQNNENKYVIVVEGPMDALSIGGVAVLGADIMDKQAMLINRLDKKVIVLPDRDPDGKRTAERALALGWGVSMPDWPLDVKDANDALRKFGRLYTIYSIINSAEFNDLKIQLRMKKWFGEKS